VMWLTQCETRELVGLKSIVVKQLEIVGQHKQPATGTVKKAWSASPDFPLSKV
jgi:hypothetical protein